MSDAATAHVEDPRVFDTYALSYAFMLLFLVPGSIAIGNLPFRQYTPLYVSLVTMPFVLGVALTFLVGSAEGLRRGLLRIAVLTPLVVVTGVAIMFGSAIALVPVSRFIRPENFTVLSWVAAALLALLASPLVVALARRVRRPAGIAWAVQSFVLAAALVLVAGVLWMTFQSRGAIGDMARKDIVIYIIGGLTWYLPSFGLAAGVWRRLGLV